MSVDDVDRQTDAWDDDFEELLRRHLSVPADQKLGPADELVQWGLDSLRTVQLLLDVEERYAIAIPDERLRADTFSTGASLWRVVEQTRRGELRTS